MATISEPLPIPPGGTGVYCVPPADPNFLWEGVPVNYKRDPAEADRQRREMTDAERNGVRRRMGLPPIWTD